MVEQVTLSALEALKRRDPEGSRGVIVGDRALNARRITIEIARPSVSARQQPVTQDSPTPAAILEIITEQERRRDCAKGTAEITLGLGDQLLVKPPTGVPRVAQKAADMLHRALIALVAGEAHMAEPLPLEDDEADGLCKQVCRELRAVRTAEPQKIDGATYRLGVASNLEGMADRVTSICERTVFLAKGGLSVMDTYRHGV